MNTPIAFIIFKREQYAREVFKAIREAKPRQLFVIADGGRTPEEWELCRKTRDIIKEVDWPCEVHTNFAETNMRTKARIKSGLDWVFSQVDRAIILEDDCVPDQSFFPFCEQMLERYADNERVCMISGDRLVREWKDDDSYLFSRFSAIWGWATWKEKWNMYYSPMDDWLLPNKKKELFGFLKHRGAMAYAKSLFDQEYNKKIDSWATHWFYGCLWGNGLTIVPTVNLVKNIGIQGVHSFSKNPLINIPLKQIDIKKIKHPEKIEHNMLYDQALYKQSFPWRPIPTPRSVMLKILVWGKKTLYRTPFINRFID